MISTLLLSLSMLLSSPAHALAPVPTEQASADDLIGKWEAIGYFYNDDWIQPEDLKTTLVFEFYEDGTNRLFWKLKADVNFCERKGIWSVANKLLQDEVTWVNPENGMDCASDPDMQVGKITKSEFWRDGDQFFLKIPLASEYLIYVWQLQP